MRFHLVLSLFEAPKPPPPPPPHYSFLRVPRHWYTNMGLNGAKTCQNRAAGTTGTGTTLTCTGTGYPLPVGTGTGLICTGIDCPLHPCTCTAQPIPIHPTGFCPKMRDFAFLTHFSSTNLLQFVPYQKSTMEYTQKQLQKWFRLNKNPFSSS